jgi:hypothetical protein
MHFIIYKNRYINCFTYSLKGNFVECFDKFYLKENTGNEVNLLCKKYERNCG